MALKPARLQWGEDGILKSLDYGDIYFQSGHGAEESDYVFLQKNNLPARFAAAERGLNIAELGFGSGLNFLLTAQAWKQSGGKGLLTYLSFEKHPIPKEDMARIYDTWRGYQHFTTKILQQYPPLIEGFHSLHFEQENIRLLLVFGDVAETLPQVSGAFDAWFLDGFSPAKNPAMWQENLFAHISARTKAGGTLATFSAAGHVRRGLAEAGFTVEKVKGYGVKRDMTVACKHGTAQGSGGMPRVAVLGAGIAGCAAAYALARRGCIVTVHDRQADCAQETSGNPYGILYPKMTVDKSPMGDFHAHAFGFTRNLLQELALPSWNPCGVLHMDLNAEDAARSRKLLEKGEYPENYARYETAGFNGVRGVAQDMAGALCPPELCWRLLAHPNITFHALQNLHALEDIEADIKVIALGYNSKNFTQTKDLPLQSLRGQISLLHATPLTQILTQVICHDGYVAPAQNGVHVFGATFQKEEPAAPELRAADHAENLEKLKKHLPAFTQGAEDIIGGRTGYRASTPDKLPMVGACPDVARMCETFAAVRTGAEAGDAPVPLHQGIYITTGFGAHGMSGAPLAGDILASLICGDPLPVPATLLAHLLPQRFIFRALKRREI